MDEDGEEKYNSFVLLLLDAFKLEAVFLNAASLLSLMFLAVFIVVVVFVDEVVSYNEVSSW